MFQTLDGKVQRVTPIAYGEIVEDFTKKYGLANALQAVRDKGLVGCTAPQLFDMRLECSSFQDPLWQNWFSTTSGIYKVGDQVIVTHGRNHPLADPQRIRSALEEGLVNYGARLTDAEVEMFREGRVDGLRPYAQFVQETADRDIQEPFSVVADVTLFKGLANSYRPLAEWRDDPRTILLAGGRKRAAQYAERLNQEKIRQSWISLDTQEGLADRGRVAFVVNYSNFFGLYGDNYLGDFGRFAGVAPEAPGAQKIGANLENRVERVAENVLRVDGKLYLLVPESLSIK